MQLSLVSLSLILAIPLAAETKPSIYVTESGAMQISGPSMAVTGPTSPENIEVMKAFLRHCPGVAVTSDREKADFVVRLDRESPSPVTPFIRGNKVAVFNRDADLVYSHSGRLLAPAVKGACAAVTARNERRPRLGNPESTPDTSGWRFPAHVHSPAAVSTLASSDADKKKRVLARNA